MSKIAIISQTTDGQAQRQVEAVQRGAQTVPATLAQLYTAAEATAYVHEFDAADAIILGCPTYNGNLSTGMEAFLEAAAAQWITLAWQDKIVGVFTNSASLADGKLNAPLGRVVLNAMQCGMIFVGLGLMPSADEPADTPPLAAPEPGARDRVGSYLGPRSAAFPLNPVNASGESASETAELYGQHVAAMTRQLIRGNKVYGHADHSLQSA